MVKPTLYLLSGLPGSGKTTHARLLAESGAVRVSVDEPLVTAHGHIGRDYPSSEHESLLKPIVDICRRKAAELLRQGSDVVFDHGLGRRSERDEMKQFAETHGAAWELLRFDTDLDALTARLAFRDLDPTTVPISDAVLRLLAQTWELPDGEGERVIDTTLNAQDFYSKTDQWWGAAESNISEIDRQRASTTAEQAPPFASILELGCGYGSTVTATAALGFSVTGVDFSSRIARARGTTGLYSVAFLKADFSTHCFGQRFDMVTYWDGFGLGGAADHVGLLNRIGSALLTPEGAAIIEIYDPTGWHQDHGLAERKIARPDAGYPNTLHHRRLFDATTGRAIDAWQQDGEAQVWHQTLQCYSPADFVALAERSVLRVDRILDDLRSDWSYLALLRPV